MAGSEAWPTIPTGNKDHLEPAVVIIGGGISGMCTAIDLIQRNNCKNFVILEKSGGVGGTWRDNKYPGCCCDGTCDASPLSPTSFANVAQSGRICTVILSNRTRTGRESTQGKKRYW